MNHVIELTPVVPLPVIMSCFANHPGLVVFDSARQTRLLGRYSYLSADPVRTFEVEKAQYGIDPFADICEALAEFPSEPLPDLPPFQGGAAGVLSYELGGCFERLPGVLHDELQIPHLAVGIYDWVVAWDHVQNRAWIISTGYPETHSDRRAERARRRLESVLATIAGGWGGRDR